MTQTPVIIRRAFIDNLFGQLHYRIARPPTPTARTVICLHASPLSGKQYLDLLPELARDRIVIAPDTPGFGESDAPDQPPEIEDYATAMIRLLDDLAAAGVIPAGPVDLLGYHTGSMTSVEIAARAPARVARLALISLPVFTDAELAEFRAQYKPRVVVEDGSHLLASWQFLMHWKDKAVDLEWCAASNAETLRGGAKAHWGHRAAFNYRMGDRLAQVEQPILALNPEDDVWEQTQRAAPLIRHGRVHDLPGWSHGFMRVRPGEVAQLLRDFYDA